MSTDIVVVGRRYTNTAGVVVTNYNFVAGSNSEPVESYDASSNTDPNAVETQVNVSVTNAANQDKAKEAAQNIANAVATIIAEAQKLPSGTVIQLPGGKTTTAGQLLTDVKATKFVVTDNSSLGNGGVAVADRNTMTDRLYFGAFAEGTGQNSYSNVGWLSQGVVGIILHEIGHITSAGFENFGAETSRWNREMAERKIPHGPADFYSLGTDYSFDNESFAHGFTMAIGGVLGINLETYDSLMRAGGSVGDYIGPDGVYSQHKSDEGF